MPNPSAQAETGDAALDAALAHWSMDAGLASLLAVSGAMLLVLDDAGERVLRAAAGAVRLREAIADSDGRVLSGLRLREQIRPAGLPDVGARLVRLRLDPRGIARPTACLIARAAPAAGISDAPVLLLAPTEPLPALRTILARTSPDAAPDRAAAEPTPTEEAATHTAPAAEAPLAPGGRFVWSSDGEGVFARVSGAGPDIAAALVRQPWRTLAARGVVSGEALLAALAEQRTFRALPLILRPERGPDAFELEVSGAPAARPGQPFAGFSGFGLLRAHRRAQEAEAAASDAGRADRPDEPIPTPAVAEPAADATSPVAEPVVAAPGEARQEPRDASPQAPPAELEPVLPASVPDPSASASAAEAAPIAGAGEAGLGEKEVGETGLREAEAPPAEPAPPARGIALSTNEHAAFREIARALGARFAGDDEGPRADHAAGDGRRGAVMAFPAGAASGQNAAIEAAIVAALDRLPAGVLVHRDGVIAFANRRVLELTGFSDRAAMQAAGGLAPLFQGRRPDEAERGGDEPVSVTTGGGRLTGLLIERSRVDWEGKPAELLLVRAAHAADPVREQAAQALLQVRDAARERDARVLLDHVEDGVATLDEGGRVLSVNRSAAMLLSGDAREIVGGTLADLLVPENAPDIAASLHEAQAAGTAAPRRVSLRARPEAREGVRQGEGAEPSPIRLRIARLPASGSARFCATLRAMPAPLPAAAAAAAPPGPALAHGTPSNGVRAADFLVRVNHEIRTPLNGILGLADAMLSEGLGPLGSERYREYLRDIHASGQHVLGVVDDLLDLARIEAGRIELTFADLALNEVVSTCIAQMQPQAARDRIVVRSSLSPDLMPLQADERSMRQATLNVIANAIRYTEAGGQVIVSTTTAERGEIAFRVRDTGIGMTEEEIADALEPFRHAEPARPRQAGTQPGGTGLGLTLTKALVEANRGEFRISSRKNEGTLVEMVFPPPQVKRA